MKNVLNLKYNTLLEMDPVSLNTLLHNEVDLDFPKTIDTNEEKNKALGMMNKAAAYICYFKEMETLARTIKRRAKSNKESQKEIDRILSCEEIFETYKRNSERVYEYISKMMTMKRLMLDETKLLGNTV